MQNETFTNNYKQLYRIMENYATTNFTLKLNVYVSHFNNENLLFGECIDALNLGEFLFKAKFWQCYVYWCYK